MRLLPEGESGHCSAFLPSLAFTSRISPCRADLGTTLHLRGCPTRRPYPCRHKSRAHNLGFPSIGGQCEPKKALEASWKGACSERELLCAAEELKKANWQIQKEAGPDVVTTGDFSLYDCMPRPSCWVLCRRV